MRWLLFLSRLGIICGVFFLLAYSLRIRDWAQDDAITSTVIIIGYIMGMVVVPIVNICYLGVLFIRRKLTAYVPLWMVIANFFFLIILILYIVNQNGPADYQT